MHGGHMLSRGSLLSSPRHSNYLIEPTLSAYQLLKTINEKFKLPLLSVYSKHLCLQPLSRNMDGTTKPNIRHHNSNHVFEGVMEDVIPTSKRTSPNSTKSWQKKIQEQQIHGIPLLRLIPCGILVWISDHGNHCIWGRHPTHLYHHTNRRLSFIMICCKWGGITIHSTHAISNSAAKPLAHNLFRWHLMTTY